MDGGMTCSPELVEAICEKVELGMTLREICDGNIVPNYRVVRRWLMDNPEFSEAIDNAFRQFVAMTAMESHKIAAGESGYSTGDVRRDGMLLEHNKWLAERLIPKLQKRQRFDVDVTDRRGLIDVEAVKTLAEELKRKGIEIDAQGCALSTERDSKELVIERAAKAPATP